MKDEPPRKHLPRMPSSQNLVYYYFAAKKSTKKKFSSFTAFLWSSHQHNFIPIHSYPKFPKSTNFYHFFCHKCRQTPFYRYPYPTTTINSSKPPYSLLLQNSIVGFVVVVGRLTKRCTKSRRLKKSWKLC